MAYDDQDIEIVRQRLISDLPRLAQEVTGKELKPAGRNELRFGNRAGRRAF